VRRGDRLHPAGKALHADVKKVSVAMTLSIEPGRAVRMYRLKGQFQCPDCLEWENGFGDESDGELDELDDEQRDERWENSYDDVFTLLLTDYVKAWFACYCDKCGLIWFPEDDINHDVIRFTDALNELSGQDFARMYTPMAGETSWCDAVEMVRKEFNLEMRYEDGVFLDQDHKEQCLRWTTKVRAKVSTDARKTKETV
jgi:hypothetical protein